MQLDLRSKKAFIYVKIIDAIDSVLTIQSDRNALEIKVNFDNIQKSKPATNLDILIVI